jgi:hypothetical protein
MRKRAIIQSSSLTLAAIVSYQAVVRGSDISKSYALPDVSNLSLPLLQASGAVVMPPGCVCKKADATSPSSSTTCDAFSCHCPCDLTAAACDPNCCCDPECPKSALVFNTTCTREFQTQTSRTKVKMCFDTSTGLEQINPSFPVRVSDTIEVSQSALFRFDCCPLF